jgi:hypothetical protein
VPKINSHPTGEKSPNLVTLIPMCVCKYVKAAGSNYVCSQDENSFFTVKSVFVFQWCKKAMKNYLPIELNN